MSLHVLILGGYGNFGGILSRRLSTSANIRLTLAGRSAEKAQQFIQAHLQHATFLVRSAVINVHDVNLADRLIAIAPDLVIHTSGPFQGQAYHVAKSCITAGIHYIDLADARDFVQNFHELDALAQDKGVLAITGASTLPALSSAVIQHFIPQFKSLEQLEYAISLGNQSERGESTVRAILSYVGKSFSTLIDRKMQSVTGWQNLHQTRFAQSLGTRWLSNCDIPDLALFQTTYPTLKTQRFYAGLELSVLHVGLWSLSWLVRFGLMTNLDRFSKPIIWLSKQFLEFGSPDGGMFMIMSGIDQQDQPLTIRWDLVALDNHGPVIPTIPALVLAQKMANGELNERGAMPCIQLMHLEEFNQAVEGFNIKQYVTYNDYTPNKNSQESA